MIVRAKRKTNFTIISNVGMADERLSFKAKGLLAYLLTKPDNWQVNERHLETIGPDGVTAVRSALKELETFGYLKRERQRNEHGLFVWTSIVYDEPCVENPSMDNPSAGNQPLIKTEETKTEAVRTEESVRARTQAQAADQKAARIMRRDYTGVEARLLTTLTNHVKRISGYVYLVDHPGDDALEDQLRDDAYRLYNLGFNSDEMMMELEQAWKSYSANFPNKMPGKDQLYKTAVMVAGGTFKQATTGNGASAAGMTLVPWEDAQHDS